MIVLHTATHVECLYVKCPWLNVVTAIVAALFLPRVDLPRRHDDQALAPLLQPVGHRRNDV